eukprot:364825-Chlamydomonas_euryale.AAC.7
MELLVRGYRLRQYHVQISTSPQPGNSGILLVNHELGRHYVTTHESMRDSMVRENGCIIAQVTYVANKDENVTATCIPSVFDGILGLQPAAWHAVGAASEDRRLQRYVRAQYYWPIEPTFIANKAGACRQATTPKDALPSPNVTEEIRLQRQAPQQIIPES